VTLLTARRGVLVHHADSLELDYPKDVDLLLADPPYGKVYQSNHAGPGETIDGDADQVKVDAILRRAWASLRPHRHAYVFGPPRDLGEHAMAELVWDKKYMAGGGLDGAWGTAHEPIWFYAHRYKSEPRAAELTARLRQGSVIREAAIRGSAKRNHPNAKPVRLWQRLIESSSLVGDFVVDPFTGGGSSAVACLMGSRQGIFAENDAKYAHRAAEWVDRVADALDGAGL